MRFPVHLCHSSPVQIVFTAFLSLMISLPAQARPPKHPHHPPHPGWFPGSPVPNPHGPDFFDGPHLPESVVFSVIAGITYAVVNGQYYRHEGRRYVYVGSAPQPPQTTVIVNTAEESSTNTTSTTQPATVTATTSSANTATATHPLSPGTIVSQLPGKVKKVTIDQRVFYVSQQTWYLALAGKQGYVVVQPQL
ncbi:DUF6515 family protein [Vibrio quintilis]|uniref:SH3b domain-containing protein n=1 Tax=Vibrio quintilis TaxID=1117707 RepID=A0A1M7Z0H7_9VIBR|nr:DUF6515 family protein [Vibrio quintilis]SHO58315.1 hypothetical protein VQ7734_04086 [Vibrio quintilis]